MISFDIRRRSDKNDSVTASSLTDSHAPFRPWLRFAGPLVAVVILGYLGWNPYKRVWIDEYLQFVLAAEDRLSEAWELFRLTGWINHGQTGLSFMSTVLSLKLFGAGLFSLRLPSLLAFVWFVVSFGMALRAAGASRWISFGATLLIAHHFDLLFMASEARVYMSLAASVIATAAFYFKSPEERRSGFWRAWGILALGFGFLNHPYYPFYLLILWVISLVHHRVPRAAWWRSTEWPIAFPAGVLGLLLASVTWMRFFGTKFGVDPFEFMRDGRSPARIFVSEHFRSIGPLRFMLPFAAGVLGWKRPARAITGPLLIVLSLGVSLLVSYMSYRSDYWILSRQWVGSVPLIHVAAVMMIASALEAALPLSLSRRAPVIAGFFMAFALHAVVTNFSVYRDWKVREASLAAPMLARGEALRQRLPAGELPIEDDDQMALAQLNCEKGGPVWPVFRTYYRRKMEGRP